jgi:hypothetical protein
VRGEREDVEVGRCESKKKTYSLEYAKGACGPSGPTKGTMACGRGGLVWWWRKREVGGAGWAKKAEWAGWLLGRLGRKLKKNPFRIKIGFLNLARLCKFAQGELGGILTQRFFLNSSRLLKDF